MPRRTTKSMGSSDKSSYDSTFSHASRHTYNTDATSYSAPRPVIKHCDTAPAYFGRFVQEPDDYRDEALPRSSVETYASTIASSDDLLDPVFTQFPRERNQCFEPDAVPATPADFAELFPSTRRLLIQHDDSSSDGNMNLRVDTEVTTTSGKRKKITLFHLRMRNLTERQFSLRRYCRDSGREVASSKRKYVKPVPLQQRPRRPTLQRSLTTALVNLGIKPGAPHRHDSGYESDDEEENLEDSLKAFTSQSGVKATVPTNDIRLEFSNYAQVVIEPRKRGKAREYGFEYWGDVYTWKRELHSEDGEIIHSYELVNVATSKRVAAMMPDALSVQETKFEATQGGWIPPSSMRILDSSISSDLGDVIIATGLIALTDDFLRQQSHHHQRRCL